jgi:acid phosphatase (class A)
MRSKLGLLAALALTAAAAGAAVAQKAANEGYLPGPAAPDTLRVLPPAPQPGSARDETDRKVFLETRALKDTPRWSLAQADVDERVLKDFTCALGVELTAANAPRLTALMTRMRRDVRHAVDTPKNAYKRQRPYLIDDGAICVPKSDDLAKSPDYPSGHTTWGWTAGLVLAELAPDKASDVLVRARAYGESRLVCGVHNLSAVEAGRTNASIVVAALHGSKRFRDDLDAARREVAKARKASPAPDAATCAREAELVANSPY